VIGIKIGHDKWIILLTSEFLLSWVFLLVILLIDIAKDGISGFIYIIVVIELEITIKIKINNINSLVEIEDKIVFNLGINPKRGGIPIIEKIEIVISIE